MAPAAGGLAPDPVALSIWLAAVLLGRVFSGRLAKIPVALAFAAGPALALALAGLALRLPGGGLYGLLLSVTVAFAGLVPVGLVTGQISVRPARSTVTALWLGLSTGGLMVWLAPGPWLVAMGVGILPLLMATVYVRGGVSRQSSRDLPPESSWSLRQRLALASGAALLTVGLLAWVQFILLIGGGWAPVRAMLPALMIFGAALGVWTGKRYGRPAMVPWLLLAAALWNLLMLAFVPALARAAVVTEAAGAGAMVPAVFTVLPLMMLVCWAWTLRAADDSADAPAEGGFQLLLAGSLVGLLLVCLFLAGALGTGRMLLFAATALPLGLALPAWLIAPETSKTLHRALGGGTLVVASLAPLLLWPVTNDLLAGGVGWQPERFTYAGQPALEDALGRTRLLGSRSSAAGLLAARQVSGGPVELTWQGWPLAVADGEAADAVAAAIPLLTAGEGTRVAVFGDRAGLLAAAMQKTRPELDVQRFDLMPGLEALAPWVAAVPVQQTASRWSTGGPWDVVLQQPLPPQVAGNGLAFSHQALTRLQASLAPGGVAALRLEVAALNRVELHRILVTFAGVFPAASLWFDGHGLVLLGAQQTPALDLAVFERRFRQAAPALLEAGIQRPLDLLARCVMSGPAMRALAVDVNAESRWWPRLIFDFSAADHGAGWKDLMVRATASQEEILRLLPALSEAQQEEDIEELGEGLQATDLWLQMLSLAPENLTEALVRGQAARVLRPADSGLRRALAAVVFRAYAAAMDAGLLRDARVMAELAVDLDPSRVEHHMAMYDQLLRRGTPAAAQRRLAVMAVQFPGEYPVLLAQARRRLDLDDVNAADSFLRRAAASGYETPALHLGMARVALARGQDAVARAHLTRALNQAPEPAPVLADLGGSLLNQDAEQAEAYLRQALDLGHDRPEVTGPLGELARRRGDYAEAILLLGRAVEQAPDVAYFRLQRGSALLMEGRSAEAVDELRLGQSLAPGDPLMRLNLAAALVREGRPREAIPELEAIGDRLAENPVYQRLRQELLP